MKKLLLILSLGFVFSCTKNDTAQNESGTMMKIDSSSADDAETSRTDGTSMRDSASATIPNGSSATPGTSPSTAPSNSSDSAGSSK